MNHLRSILIAGLLCTFTISEMHAVRHETPYEIDSRYDNTNNFSQEKAVFACGIGAMSGAIFCTVAKQLIRASGDSSLGFLMGAGLGASVLAYMAVNREKAIKDLLGEEYVGISYMSAVGMALLLFINDPIKLNSLPQ